MSFSESNLLAYLEGAWNADTVDKPATFTSDDQLLNYADTLHVKRHRINNAWIAAGVKRAFDYYEITLQHDTEAAIDELERILLAYPGSTAYIIDEDFSSDLSDWTTIAGTPAIVGGELQCETSDRTKQAAVFTSSEYELRLTARFTTEYKSVYFYLKNAAGSTICDLALPSSGNLRFNSVTEAKALNVDTDYDFRITFDFANEQNSLYIDDTLERTEDFMNSTSDIAELYLGSNVIGDTYYDDVQIATLSKFSGITQLVKKLRVEIDELPRDYVNYYKFRVRTYVINYE